MRITNKGETLTKEELLEIKNNYVVSNHAKQRMKERGFNENDIPKLLDNPYLAFFNYDYTINVAKNENEYFVISHNIREKKFVIVTFKEPSTKKSNIHRKHMLSILGVRYNHKQNNPKGIS